MKATEILDTDTGLPVLPVGQFWRVIRRHNVFGDWLEVNLRRRTWYGSAWVASRSCERNAEGVRQTAVQILADRAQWLAEDRAMDDLAGDYPPNRLEDH